MSRSGYTEDYYLEDPLMFGAWRGRVASAIRGKRGQQFLRDVRDAMLTMPEKRLIEGYLERDGEFCLLGIGLHCRGAPIPDNHPEDEVEESVAQALNIAMPLAQECAFMNDEGTWGAETPEARYIRILGWVESKIKP